MSGQGERFQGVARLFGERALARLQKARVAVIGLGGVGSWTVEALVRSGIGKLLLVDLDDVCVSNFNRQIHALDERVGEPKAEVMADRVRRINPECQVDAAPQFFTERTATQLLSGQLDYVVDAIDRVANKCLLIVRCHQNGIPLVTSGGAGGRTDGVPIEVKDLAQSRQDRLLAEVRRQLRKEHQFPRDPGQPFGVTAVYFNAPMLRPKEVEMGCDTEALGTVGKRDCVTGYGTAAFVTGALGLAAAGVVIRALARQSSDPAIH